MDRGAWQAKVHVVSKNWIGLFNYHFHIDTILKKQEKKSFFLKMRTEDLLSTTFIYNI